MYILRIFYCFVELTSNLSPIWRRVNPKKACCEVCLKTIHPIETRTLRDIRYMRYRLGIGQRDICERPVTLDMFILREWDGADNHKPPSQDPNDKWERISVPYTKHMTLLGLPVFIVPGYLRHIPPNQCSEKTSLIKLWLRHHPNCRYFQREEDLKGLL